MGSLGGSNISGGGFGGKIAINDVLTTQGDIVYHNGTTATRLAAGTSGQFLKTLGAAANPAWATAGLWQLIADEILTGATASIDVTSIASGYAALQIIFIGSLAVDGSINVKFNNDGGNNYNYENLTADAAVVGASTGTTSSMPFAAPDGANVRCIGSMLVSQDASYVATIVAESGSKNYGRRVSGDWADTTEINQVTIVSTQNMNIGSRLIILGLLI